MAKPFHLKYKLGVKGKLLVTVSLLTVLLSLGVAWYMTQMANEQAALTALDGARVLSAQIREMRGFYTSKVVGVARGKDVKATHDYAQTPGTIPLPATMVHEIAESLSQKERFKIRLYSAYPFPFRQNGGARDEFEQAALKYLQANPQGTFWRREVYNGVPAIRYASADLMVTESCVTCHNSHALSPKKDWKVGDVRGVLQVVMPIDRTLAAAQASARNTALMIVVALFAAIIIIAFIIRRACFTPLREMVEVSGKLAVGDIDQTIRHESPDEIGALANAFRSLIAYSQEMVGAANALSRGDLTVKVVPRSERDVLAKSVAQAQETLQELVSETGQAVHRVEAGQLDQRSDPTRYQGGYAELICGMNGMLDAVTAPINEASNVLEQVATRKLTARMQGDYQGYFAKIKEALNTAVSNLGEALAQVAAGAEQVALASDQIKTGSQSLAQGASEQASSLEEVSASLQETALIGKQNATQAQEACRLAESAHEKTTHGAESMQRLSQAVNQIKASADATAKIVKTIDEIAFQTNLLALNAAVEAARAGDAGKGFAVVAEEVRNLAMRSAEAAQNTAALIEESVRNTESGVKLNQEVMANLAQINRQVQRVSEVVTEMAAASNQQSQGVEQINRAITQMNQVTQQTAANAEESAAAAEELSGQSEEMLKMVGAFELRQRTNGGQPKSVRAGSVPKLVASRTKVTTMRA